MNLTLQILLSGLAAGSVCGLLVVGHTLVYRLTGIVHFALGDLVGLGVFIALFVTSGRGPVTAASASSWRFAAGLVVALLATAALGSGRAPSSGAPARPRHRMSASPNLAALLGVEPLPRAPVLSSTLRKLPADAREREMQEPLVSRCTCGHVEEGPAGECIAAMTRHLDRCQANRPSDSR